MLVVVVAILSCARVQDDNGMVKFHGEPKEIPDGYSHRELIYMIDGADFERGSSRAASSSSS